MVLVFLLVFQFFFSFDVQAVDPACDIVLANEADRVVLQEMHALKLDALHAESRVDQKIFEERFSLKLRELAAKLKVTESRLLTLISQSKLPDNLVLKAGATPTEVRKKTIPHLPINFGKLPPGKFKMEPRSGTEKLDVELTYEIEVMTTKVTQMHWVDIFGENPAEFKKGDNEEVLSINGYEILLQPDNPIENITWYAALWFANELSIQSGLKPTYDFSEIEWMPGTSAAMGTLKPLSGHVKINAPDGDIYRAEGYRLLTSAEHEYLRTDCGRAANKYWYFDDVRGGPDEFPKHIWYNKNSNNSTQPVALLLPLIIDNNSFFDLYGNAYEWSNNKSTFMEIIEGGKNPSGLKGNYTERAIYGGSYNRERGDFRAYKTRVSVQSDKQSKVIGFRLTRTLNPKDD